LQAQESTRAAYTAQRSSFDEVESPKHNAAAATTTTTTATLWHHHESVRAWGHTHLCTHFTCDHVYVVQLVKDYIQQRILLLVAKPDASTVGRRRAATGRCRQRFWGQQHMQEYVVGGRSTGEQLLSESQVLKPTATATMTTTMPSWCNAQNVPTALGSTPDGAKKVNSARAVKNGAT
jgi:hypothetical protein